MAHSDGPDPLPEEVQLDMFGAAPTARYPDSPDLRAELDDVLAKVRAAPSERWSPDDTTHLRNIFARMAERLPSEEARQLRLELDAELVRLTAA